MIKILCPTDFSTHAQHALRYAIHLSNDIGAELHIIHAYQVNKRAASLVSIDDIVHKNNVEDMEKLVAGLGNIIQQDNVPVTKVLKGNPIEKILRYIDKNGIDLLLMGTQGANSVENILFGSTTKKLAAKSPVPVLAIPNVEVTELTMGKVLLALDSKLLPEQAKFKVPIHLASKLGFKIDVIHVEDKKEDIPIDPIIETHLGEHMGTIEVIQGEDPIDTLKKYAEQHNADLLMMVRREKSFFQKLILKRNTAAELGVTNIPLLIIPE